MDGQYIHLHTIKSQYIGYCKITIKCIINATKLKCQAEENLDFESVDVEVTRQIRIYYNKFHCTLNFSQ